MLKRWRLHASVGVLTLAVLAYGVVEQVYDTNFYVLWEATAILQGDRPYRDFYLIGWPLVTALSTFAQWVSGYRLIAEFVLHWIFIVAGMVIGFHLALRVSRAVAASLITSLIALVILLGTPTFHYPKLFIYPLAILTAWRYIERPDVRRAVVCGVVTAAAFFFRHDHGVYIAIGYVVTCALTPRRTLSHAAACASIAAALVAPWAVFVHLNEGLADFVRTRLAWGETWGVTEAPYRSLLRINPFRVADNYEAAGDWLLQITVVVPILVIASAGYRAFIAWRRDQPVPLDAKFALAGGSIAVIAGARLLRQPAYFQALVPVTAALSAQLLAGAFRGAGIARVGRSVTAALICVVTVIAAAASLDRDLFAAGEVRQLREVYRQLVASPPIDAYQPAEDALAATPEDLADMDEDERFAILIRYMHDCTRDDDRLLVIGSTPYHVGYLAERPIAGGHLQWVHGWRSDTAHEARSLALIENQSVPFVFSTHDLVMWDMRIYPRIHQYLMRNYAEVPGTDGRLLVDRRRQAAGTFGQLGYPCFK